MACINYVGLLKALTAINNPLSGQQQTTKPQNKLPATANSSALTPSQLCERSFTYVIVLILPPPPVRLRNSILTFYRYGS